MALLCRGGFLADARSALKQQDFATAHTMLELEARRGNAAAMNELGYLYLRGHGVAQDCRQAYMWFSLAISFAPDEAFRHVAVDNQFTAEVNGNLKSRDKSEAHRSGMSGWRAIAWSRPRWHGRYSASGNSTGVIPGSARSSS